MEAEGAMLNMQARKLPWKKEKKKKQKQKQTQTQTQKTSNSTSLSSSPAPLESLTLGTLRYKTGLESPRSTRAIVDALSLSGLPFLQLRGLDTIDPAIEAQLRRNQRLFILGDLQKVPATSMRLFICGDPFAGRQITPYLPHETFIICFSFHLISLISL